MMRYIVGSTNSGKTLLSAIEAIKAAKTSPVVILTDDPRRYYAWLSTIYPKSGMLKEITVKYAQDVTDVMKHLVYNSSQNMKLFVDVSAMSSDALSRVKVEGFTVGARIDAMITWQTNMLGTSHIAGICEPNASPEAELEYLTKYTKKDLDKLIEVYQAG